MRRANHSYVFFSNVGSYAYAQNQYFYFWVWWKSNKFYLCTMAPKSILTEITNKKLLACVELVCEKNSSKVCFLDSSLAWNSPNSTFQCFFHISHLSFYWTKKTAAKHNTRKQSNVTMWNIKKLHQKTRNRKNLKSHVITWFNREGLLRDRGPINGPTQRHRFKLSCFSY